jgi:hypothetical protein
MTTQSIAPDASSRATDAAPSTPGPWADPRAVVPTLWIFVMLNYLYCDLIGLMHAPDLRGFLEGEVGGLQITTGFLLGAGVLMEIPMLMVVVSRLAPHAVARWASVAAGALMTLVQVGSLTLGDNTPHYWFFSAVEITTTLVITWYAATRWRREA